VFLLRSYFLVQVGQIPHGKLVSKSSLVTITKAKGTIRFDDENRQILDFTLGQMSGLLRHSRPEIVEVANKYVGELDHLLSNMITYPVVNLGQLVR
jgi:4-aminobutyrate aminotransferase-like enzyme